MITEPQYFTSNEETGLRGLVALFEGNFSIDWVAELTGKKASQVLAVLEKWIRRGWLTRKGPGIFSFKNVEERRKWETSLSLEEKERLHQQIVTFLLSDLPNDEVKAQTVAPHLLQIHADLEKCQWLVKSGDSFYKANRYEQALGCYSKVLDELSSIHSEASDRLFTETAIKYSKVATARYDIRKVASILEEALIRAKRQNIEASIALLLLHMAKCDFFCQRFRKAERNFQKGWFIVNKLNHPNLVRSALAFNILFLNWQGKFRDVVKNYEMSVPDVERFPQGNFPLLATLTVGFCYARIGHTTQALGMLDAIRTHCGIIKNKYMGTHAGLYIGITLLDARRMEEAVQCLESSVEEARQVHNDWTRPVGALALAYGYHLQGDSERSLVCLREFLQHRKESHMAIVLLPYLLDLCWAMEGGKLPSIGNLSLEGEIRQSLMARNIFIKGVAYRYQALLQRRDDSSPEKIVSTLKNSVRWLEESGHQVELAISQFELARQYLLLGDLEEAKNMAKSAAEILPSENSFVPDDLRYLIKNQLPRENLINEILKLGQEVVAIRDNRDLVQHIISIANRITGAERGAIFLCNNDISPPNLYLRASKNLTSEQVEEKSFSSSMKMIEEVATSGKGRILETVKGKDSSVMFSGPIRSRICVPMKLREKIMGVLYHDNRLFSSAFEKSDLELLAYFAAQAAIALDNAGAYEEIQRLNRKLKEENRYYEEQHLQTHHFEDIIGESPGILEVLEKVDRVAKTEATILLMGETGAGKELVARAIHRHSLRRNKPFIRVFCNALTDSLIPSELFGHERGAFTGATRRRIGRFELADKGTLFLDEIGDLPLDIQVRLLQVLQSKEFERVGGSETIHSDFRLITATNRDLQKAVNDGKFRADLYYRLNVFPIIVPPLRERKEDIPLLAHYILKYYTTKMSKTIEGIPKSEMEKLMHYDWPGNVRELENIIERAAILSSGPLLRIPELGINRAEIIPQMKDTTLSGNERRHILWALEKTAWKVRGAGGAAEMLKIHPSTLNFRMKKLMIERPQEFSRKNCMKCRT